MKQQVLNVTFKGEQSSMMYIKDASLAEKAINKLMEQERLFAIDIETMAKPEWRHIKDAALDPKMADIRLIQIYNGKNGAVFDMKYIKNIEIFRKFLENRRFIAHNSKFELSFFYTAGIRKLDIGCTFLMAKCIFHAAQASDAGLKASLEALVEGFLGVKISKMAQVSNWGNTELTYEQVEYAGMDVISLYRLAEQLVHGIKKYDLKQYYRLVKDAQHPIVKMQLNGISFNKDAHREMIPGWRLELFKAKKELKSATGLDKITSPEIAKWLEKTLEPELLEIWPRTDPDRGEPKLKTDAHTLSQFDFLDIVKPFAKYQKNQKLCSSFGAAFENHVSPVSNKMHPSFNICGARTGRLSASSPNLQQMPRDKNIRSLFTATPGYKLIRADFNQIELRVAAELSRDVKMLEAYREGVDIHKLTAATISGRPIETIGDDDPDRQKAKAINFGLLFGLGARSLVSYAKKLYGREMTPLEAEHAVETFREFYAGYRAYQLEQASTGAKTLYTRTPYGKLRKLDSEFAYGASMNTPVQGGAAESMLASLIEWDSYDIPYEEARLVNCVHDEAICEVREDLVDECMELVNDCMVAGYRRIFPNGIINNLVGINYGDTWSEAKS